MQSIASMHTGEVDAAVITTTKVVIVAVRRTGKRLNMVRSTVGNSREKLESEEGR